MTLPVAFRDGGRDRTGASDLARGKVCTMGATQKESACGFLFFSWSGERERLTE